MRLSEAMVGAADLVLTSSRDVSGGVSALSLEARSRTFTLLRAAAGALYVAGFLESGELPPGAAPLPPQGDVEGRWEWFLTELDASRGQAPLVAGPDPEAPDDLPDPHQGVVAHDVMLAALAQACDEITSGARAVLSAQ